MVESILSAETRKWCLNTAQDRVTEGKVSGSTLSDTRRIKCYLRVYQYGYLLRPFLGYNIICFLTFFTVICDCIQLTFGKFFILFQVLTPQNILYYTQAFCFC